MIPDLASWAGERNLDHAIWMALTYRSKRQPVRMSADQVIAHLSALTGQARRDAEEYVCRAPPQIDTAYCRRIEAALGRAN